MIFMSLPLLVRPNSVIPIGDHTDKPDYDYSDQVTLQVYQLEDGKPVHVEIPTLDGKIETSFDIAARWECDPHSAAGTYKSVECIFSWD